MITFPITLGAKGAILRRLWISTAIALQSVLTTAVFAAGTAAATKTNQPVITFDAMRYNFGVIEHHHTVTHLYRVTNSGNAVLHIKDVAAVCGCTSTVIGKMELAPGESTDIQAVFTPEKRFTGAVSKTIRVRSDDPSHPTLTLRFFAKVLPDEASPQSAG